MFNWWETALNANMASIYRGLPVKGIKKIALDVINWPQEVLRFDATNITTSSIEQFISDYNTVKPKIIHGYVGAVDTIADYILEHDIRFDFQPNAIWLTAAPITSIQEHKISKAFQSKVCDQYGCSEIFFIAAECPHKKGLHVFSDSVKLEIVDEKGKPVQDGTFGKIILTNLDEFSFPLIRYENGDEGRYLTKTCDCNLSLPLIDKVKGRISDNLTLPDGRILSGEYLTTIFDDFTDNVKQFQIIQLKNLDLLVRVNLYNQHDAGFIKKMILNEFLPKIKNQVAIKIEIVQSIKQDKGKIQFIVKE
jgi:phenylacetate-CoA ligase